MSFWELLFPNKCPICKEPNPVRISNLYKRTYPNICDGCINKLPFVTEPRCKHCGKPVSDDTEEICSDCLGQVSCFEKGVGVWVYDRKMKSVMADFKYGGCESDAKTFAEHLCRSFRSEIDEWEIDGIVPVPIHWRRRWFRGYNQAELIANHVGKNLGIDVYSGILVRDKHTKAQNRLDNKQRRANLQKVIKINTDREREIEGCKNILLIDDIYTTGATMEACAQTLKDNGVSKVYCAYLCVGSGF